MRAALTSNEVYKQTASIPIPAALSEAIVVELIASDFGRSIDLGDAPRVVAHGALYKPVGLEEFHRLPAAAQAAAIAIRGSTEMAVASTLNEHNAVLKVGDVDLDVKSATTLVVTRGRDYAHPLGCIELDSAAQLLSCFRHNLRTSDSAPRTMALTPATPFSSGTGVSGATMPPKFVNILAIYAEQVLRLHVLFSCEAGAPRRVIVDSVSVVDVPGAEGRQPRTFVSCKFHAACGLCFCKSRTAIRHPATGIVLSMGFCGGEVGPAGRCLVCGRESEHKRCLDGFAAPQLTCKHQRDGGGSVVGSKMALPVDFLNIYAVACVEMRHTADPGGCHDRLECALDESIALSLSQRDKTRAGMALHDQWVEAMLATGSFAFDSKRNALCRRGGVIKKWHREAARGFEHLFPRK